MQRRRGARRRTDSTEDGDDTSDEGGSDDDHRRGGRPKRPGSRGDASDDEDDDEDDDAPGSSRRTCRPRGRLSDYSARHDHAGYDGMDNNLAQYGKTSQSRRATASSQRDLEVRRNGRSLEDDEDDLPSLPLSRRRESIRSAGHREVQSASRRGSKTASTAKTTAKRKLRRSDGTSGTGRVQDRGLQNDCTR